MTDEAAVTIGDETYHLTASGWCSTDGTTIALVDVLQMATKAGDRVAADTALRLHRDQTARAIANEAPDADGLFDDYAHATDLLDVAAAAGLIGIGQPTLRKYNAARPGPPHLPAPTLTLGGSPLWARQALNAWLASRPGRGHRRHGR